MKSPNKKPSLILQIAELNEEIIQDVVNLNKKFAKMQRLLATAQNIPDPPMVTLFDADEIISAFKRAIDTAEET